MPARRAERFTCGIMSRADVAVRRLSADPMVWRRASARRPGPELVGVEYCPDVPDPAARDVERQHRPGDAVQLSDQARLTVDRALQDRHVGYRNDPIDEEACDLLGAFDRAELGADEAAAVAGRRGIGLEEADEGADVLGFPCLLEGPDDAGLLDCRNRGRLQRTDAAAG